MAIESLAKAEELLSMEGERRRTISLPDHGVDLQWMSLAYLNKGGFKFHKIRADVIEEAKQENYRDPTELAFDHAYRVLTSLGQGWRYRAEVYPTVDGEVCLVFAKGAGSSVLVLCASDATALCLVNIEGRQRTKRYRNASNLPDDFLRRSLGSLPEKSE